ncbi:prephenate dehydratase domain-containing protein [Breoghania corrubedonensis]|uniref:prephenate dehydratase domain-containing protein n=1 Tax=Breoghania corrubedonensis TaxID=665038 RepID=UPI001AECB997|nr:prephenate dehydratase domain-containing protein [Breoghania corrubedonensis]
MRRPFAPAVVTYHGSAGAFAHIACRAAFPRARAIACDSLLQVIEAVRTGTAEAAVLPCENLLAGRVPDIHLLLPEIGMASEIGLTIVGEIFLPIELHLVAPAGRSLDQIRRVHSHPVALNQVRRFLSARGLAAVEQSNTATAAALVRRAGEEADAAVASELAARTYGLTILERNIEDNPVNMTRFYVLARDPVVPALHEPDILTSLLFELHNAPGALFRALGGFADAGINMTKLESYLVDGQFVATRFLCEFEGHPERDDVRQAIDILARHSTRHAILGVFPMHATGTRTRADASLGGVQ